VPQIRPGTCLDDRYVIGDLVATGGMGEVWRARDRQLDRTVAIKVLRTVALPDPMASERLEAEARAAAMLTSDHVVQVHDLGFYDDGRNRRAPYLVMELVDGTTLRYASIAPAAVVRQVAEALREAHAHGLVHRDVKPANVIVTPSGQCKLTDFGIASAAEPSGLTDTGLVVGTARYLSPEQVSGQRATSASDVYALGVVAYELLSGGPLFTGESDVAAALAHVQQQPRPLPSSVDPALAALVLSMLAKDPAARPTAAGVLAALDGEPVPTTRAPAAAFALTARLPRVVTPRPARRSRPLPMLIAAALVLLVGTIGAWLATSGSAQEQPLTGQLPSVAQTTAPSAEPAIQPVAHVVASTPSPKATVKAVAKAAPKPAAPKKHGKGKTKH
jgi:serine/threonine protein kinase